MYATVRGRFEAYFVKKKNIVFDRVRFFQRRQEEGEPVASFVNDVRAMAKYSNFGALHEELIRNILVAGIRVKRLSEQLQMEGADLTLNKAVTCIWQSETVHQQQGFLHREDTRQFPIDAVKTSKRPGKTMSDTCRVSGPSKKMMCSRCGKSANHDIGVHVCPAKGIIFRKCGKKRHFQRACRSKKISLVNETPEQIDKTFRGRLGAKDRIYDTICIKLNLSPISNAYHVIISIH